MALSPTPVECGRGVSGLPPLEPLRTNRPTGSGSTYASHPRPGTRGALACRGPRARACCGRCEGEAKRGAWHLRPLGRGWEGFLKRVEPRANRMLLDAYCDLLEILHDADSLLSKRDQHDQFFLEPRQMPANNQMI